MPARLLSFLTLKTINSLSLVFAMDIWTKKKWISLIHKKIRQIINVQNVEFYYNNFIMNIVGIILVGIFSLYLVDIIWFLIDSLILIYKNRCEEKKFQEHSKLLQPLYSPLLEYSSPTFDSKSYFERSQHLTNEFYHLNVFCIR